MRWLKILLVLLMLTAFITGFTQIDKAVQKMLDWDYTPAFQLQAYPPQPKVILLRQEFPLPGWAAAPGIFLGKLPGMLQENLAGR